ncbi:MAG: biotin--[acetyl-CoA-carboxylase] ligase [Deltaproteobacteria bacterium]
MEDLVELATRRVSSRWVGHPLVLRATSVSTNDEAREAAQKGAPAGYTVVADAQTHGRGRRGRTWHSPPGESLYVSVVMRPPMRPDEAPVLTLTAGLAVRDAVAHFVEPASRVTIKWPNDVRVDGLKVAGVLVEGSVRGAGLAFAVVGIGVNVRGLAMPEELAARATTLRLACGADVSRASVLEALLVALERRAEELQREGAARIVETVSAHCDTLGTEVTIDDVRGRAVSIAVDGALRVERADGTVTEVRAGEVQ